MTVTANVKTSINVNQFLQRSIMGTAGSVRLRLPDFETVCT
jgi:hypothetical protein